MAVATLGFVGCGGKTTAEGSAGTGPAAGTAQGANADATGDPNAGKFNPAGTYIMQDKQVGSNSILTVTKAGDQISYTLEAGLGNTTEMYRAGTMVLVADKEFEDNDDACQISFNFGNGSVDLSYIGGGYEGCGEVDCAGSYKKY